MKYTLGLDIGIASLGWAIYSNESNNLIDSGVRIFDVGENPKDKSPLSSVRRDARSSRRRFRRTRYRMQKIRELMLKSNLITQKELDNLFCQKSQNGKKLYNVYELRYLALTTKLSNKQLVKVFTHLAKHRGFKSNRKKDKTIDGKVNKSLKENSLLLSKYSTVGEMLYKDKKFAEHKRNKGENYNVMLQRADLEKEAKIILEKQSELGNDLITDDFITEYIYLFNRQQSFDWRGDIQTRVGSCFFETEEKRAPKSCFSSMKFIALSKINNIKIIDDGIESRIPVEKITEIFTKVLTKKSGVSFWDIRSILNLPTSARFNFVDYKNDDLKDCEKTPIPELKFKDYHELKKAISDNCGGLLWQSLENNIELFDGIGIALTYSKTDETIKENITKAFDSLDNSFSNVERDNIIKGIIESGIGYDKNISLSLKALSNIIPHLERGCRYDEACEKAGYNHSSRDSDRFKKLPPLHKTFLADELTNPVVIRSVTQLRKVVNAIIAKYGSPYKINIELARDVGKSAKNRNEIEKKQKENLKSNKKLVEEFNDTLGREPRAKEKIKFRLWKQQGNKCAYSGKYINLEDIQDGKNLTQIDHIIPYSRSFNNSLINKVLCLTSENQNKRNQTPYEYLGSDEQNWHRITEVWANMKRIGYQYGFDTRKERLLKLKKLDEQGFIERNINDTRYIARLFQNYLKQYLEFADKTNKKPVMAISGGVTGFVRKFWGLQKIRSEGDKHHAQDACVIACINERLIQQVTKFMKAKSYGRTPEHYYVDRETGEVFEKFPLPYDEFTADVEKLLDKVFVSRMPTRRISGATNMDTIRSRKYYDNPLEEGKTISTVKKSLVDSGIKIDATGEIENICPTYAIHNPNIYQLLKDRLNQHDKDVKKAFAETLYAPRKDGTSSDTPIKTIKVIKTQNTGVAINHGVADNGDMVRVDIFRKNGKNFIVPIYMHQTILPELPNMAIVAKKPEDEWELMDNKAEFIYSIYKNDLIKIITKKERYFGYYVGTHRGTGAITIKEHDSSAEHSIGIKLNAAIEKYNVNELGSYIKIAKEKRQSFARKKDLRKVS